MIFDNDFLKINSNPFHSFLMGGFECSDQLNAFGNRVDLYKMSGHDIFLSEDYRNLKQLGIKTVREGIRWSDVEKKPYEYDWSEVEKLISVSQNQGIQIIWDMCHFGFPDDLTPLHPMFARRFTHLCAAFVHKYRSLSPSGDLIITPINEVSFISWLGGDVRGTSPYCNNNGWEVKYSLMKAYIEAVEVMKRIDCNVRIMTTEPLISIVSENPSDAEAVLLAQKKNIEQFQVLDMLCGNMCPELGGKPEYLDIIGVNYYYNNQWIAETHEFLPWAEDPPNPFWRSLPELISEVYLKYRRPVVISETSHPKEDRPKWLKKIAEDCAQILQSGIPLLGCCIYPVIDRPDWDYPEIWHHSGIWDIYNPETLERIMHEESFDACIMIAKVTEKVL